MLSLNLMFKTEQFIQESLTHYVESNCIRQLLQFRDENCVPTLKHGFWYEVLVFHCPTTIAEPKSILEDTSDLLKVCVKTRGTDTQVITFGFQLHEGGIFIGQCTHRIFIQEEPVLSNYFRSNHRTVRHIDKITESHRLNSRNGPVIVYKSRTTRLITYCRFLTHRRTIS